MKILITNRKITLSILMTLVLICGLSGVSYGEDAITLSNLTCEASGLFVTLKGTIRANRDVKDVEVWLAINGERIGPNGLPAIDFPNIGYLGGESLGDLSAGETRSFSITRQVLGLQDGDECGIFYEAKEADPPVTETAEVLVVDPNAPPIYWTDWSADRIRRVILDGSNVQDLVTTGLRSPRSIALDVAGGKIYWADAWHRENPTGKPRWIKRPRPRHTGIGFSKRYSIRCCEWQDVLG